MNKYLATFDRDQDGVWLVELVEEPRVHTYGRTLAAARTHIRDAAAVWFDVEPAEIEIIENLRLPKAVQATVTRARKQRAQSQAVQEAAASATREAARALVLDGHLTMRDAADVLGLSHQRIQQLLAG